MVQKMYQKLWTLKKRYSVFHAPAIMWISIRSTFLIFKVLFVLLLEKRMCRFFFLSKIWALEHVVCILRSNWLIDKDETKKFSKNWLMIWAKITWPVMLWKNFFLESYYNFLWPYQVSKWFHNFQTAGVNVHLD